MIRTRAISGSKGSDDDHGGTVLFVGVAVSMLGLIVVALW